MEKSIFVNLLLLLFYFIFRNLYKSQKLLSVPIDSDLPVFSHDSKTWFPTAEYVDHDELDILPISVILVVVSAVLIIIFRYFLFRKRPRRKRSNKLGRFLSMLKVPNVQIYA